MYDLHVEITNNPKQYFSISLTNKRNMLILWAVSNFLLKISVYYCRFFLYFLKTIRVLPIK